MNDRVTGDDALEIPTGWDRVLGQPRVVDFLRGVAASPVHAYLFIGPAGSGKRAAAAAFAGDILAAVSPEEHRDRHRRLAHAERHPDLIVVEREGAFINAEQARSIAHRSALAPVEGTRKVLLLDEFHLVRDAGPILLKAIEEPPSGTVFLVLADELPPELITIASRCVRVDFAPVPQSTIAAALRAQGVDPDRADAVAGAAGGNVGRARLLATDEGLDGRVASWQSLVDRLDGTGHRVATLVDEIQALLDEAQEPVAARQAQEVTDLAAREERYGERGSGRKALDERHKRERRRLRTDELRFGLAVVARRCRDQLIDEPDRSISQLTAIQAAAEALDRNPSERLLLERLLIALG